MTTKGEVIAYEDLTTAKNGPKSLDYAFVNPLRPYPDWTAQTPKTLPPPAITSRGLRSNLWTHTSFMVWMETICTDPPSSTGNEEAFRYRYVCIQLKEIWDNWGATVMRSNPERVEVLDAMDRSEWTLKEIYALTIYTVHGAPQPGSLPLPRPGDGSEHTKPNLFRDPLSIMESRPTLQPSEDTHGRLVSCFSSTKGDILTVRFEIDIPAQDNIRFTALFLFRKRWLCILGIQDGLDPRAGDQRGIIDQVALEHFSDRVYLELDKGGYVLLAIKRRQRTCHVNVSLILVPSNRTKIPSRLASRSGASNREGGGAPATVVSRPWQTALQMGQRPTFPKISGSDSSRCSFPFLLILHSPLRDCKLSPVGLNIGTKMGNRPVDGSG